MTEEQSALIAKIEAATGPSRELEEEIALAVGWRRWELHHHWFAPPGSDKWQISAPLFTASIEVALALVPDGWRVFSMEQISAEGFWHVGIISEKAPRELYNIKHKVLPIAICIAALKARFV